ncbi:hypothetical protein Fcan01_26572 [Folsomia candida]|uniref:Uncharacterized protein n=1 Tax=Folsomia candida TaxID=158441 RepID=A0A226D196_FOLCA|nr:hypothetical protein Fcan01_26572 [Folsomia candida]
MKFSTNFLLFLLFCVQIFCSCLFAEGSQLTLTDLICQYDTFIIVFVEDGNQSLDETHKTCASQRILVTMEKQVVSRYPRKYIFPIVYFIFPDNLPIVNDYYGKLGNNPNAVMIKAWLSYVGLVHLVTVDGYDPDKKPSVTTHSARLESHTLFIVTKSQITDYSLMEQIWSGFIEQTVAAFLVKIEKFMVQRILYICDSCAPTFFTGISFNPRGIHVPNFVENMQLELSRHTMSIRLADTELYIGIPIHSIQRVLSRHAKYQGPVILCKKCVHAAILFELQDHLNTSFLQNTFFSRNVTLLEFPSLVSGDGLLAVIWRERATRYVEFQPVHWIVSNTDSYSFITCDGVRIKGASILFAPYSGNALIVTLTFAAFCLLIPTWAEKLATKSLSIWVTLWKRGYQMVTYILENGDLQLHQIHGTYKFWPRSITNVTLASLAVFFVFANNFYKSFLSADEVLRPDYAATVTNWHDLTGFRIVTPIDTDRAKMYGLGPHRSTGNMRLTNFGFDVYQFYSSLENPSGYRNQHVFTMTDIPPGKDNRDGLGYFPHRMNAFLEFIESCDKTAFISLNDASDEYLTYFNDKTGKNKWFVKGVDRILSIPSIYRFERFNAGSRSHQRVKMKLAFLVESGIANYFSVLFSNGSNHMMKSTSALSLLFYQRLKLTSQIVGLFSVCGVLLMVALLVWALEIILHVVRKQIHRLNYYLKNIKLRLTVYESAVPSLNLPPVDLEIFLMMRNVKSINVAYEPGDELKFLGYLGNKIILAACPTLNALEFDGHSFPNLEGTVFLKLKKVTTYCTLYKVHDREKFGHAVKDSFKNLQYVNTASDHLISMPMISLNRLVLHGIPDTTGGLECLLEIPGSLRELNFSVNFQVDDRVDEMPRIFYTFLKKHSTTLEILSICMF